MTLRSDWPALLLGSFPRVLECERAVWGKAHGAPTDYRWIAQSAAFGRDQPNLPRQLNLGGEDLPAPFQSWRNLGDRCYAVTCYPSRAVDTSGRRGFLEKQVLEWRRPSYVPAALGALLLLPRAAALTDTVWWDRDDAMELQIESEAVLRIAKPEPITVHESELAETIERGREVLRQAIGSESLARLYDQLFARRRPSYLAGLREPLPPEALAALLLPLPREIADQISIAGWIPTSRPSYDDLATRWDVLTADRSVAPIAPDRAIQVTQALLDGRPSDRPQEPEPVVASHASVRDVQPFRPGTRLELRAPDAGEAPFLHQLYAFAAACDRRWLDLTRLRLEEEPGPWGALLCEWATTVRAEKPPHADREQWTAKADLLRSAAIVLAPSLSTLNAVGMPDETSRVPALLFVLSLERASQKALARLGPHLRQLVSQSLRVSRSTELNQRLSRVKFR